MSNTGNNSPLYAALLIIGCIPADCQLPSGQHASPPMQLASSTSNAASPPSVGLVHHSALRRPLNEYVADGAPRLLQLQKDATDYYSSSSCQLEPERGIVFRATCCRLYYGSATGRLMENAGNVLVLPSAMQMRATPKRKLHPTSYIQS